MQVPTAILATRNASSSDQNESHGANVSCDRRSFLKLSGAAIATSSLGACSGAEKVPTIGAPRSDFDADATAEEVTEGLDLKGKLAVVTGCTSGIGFETMRVLAKRGAHVIGTGRTAEKADAACRIVNGITSPVALELSDFDSVVACADAIRTIKAPIDILVCNAGFYGGSGEREVINGIEKHLVVNHLGHFVLVNRLLDRLFFSWQGRVVVVASRTAYRNAPETGIQFDNLALAGNYDDRRAYGHSKLANVLFSLELARLFKGTRITSNSLHPGLINTQIDRYMSGIKQKGFALLSAVGGAKSIEEGAATSCFVATSPVLGSTSGHFFEDCNAVTVLGDNHLYNSAMATRLWQVSEELTRSYLVDYTQADWEELEKELAGRGGETPDA
jgi:NAD(P)-dependent dehydrogenase (short-subunit alcohol dehydrogenase family)